MYWISQAYADVFEVMLGHSNVYRSTDRCDKHIRSGEKYYRKQSTS